MEAIQNRVDNITNINTIEGFNNILSGVVKFNDMACVVYVYDKLKAGGLTPTNETYQIINRLHSKTIPDKKIFRIPPNNKKTLQPRRRIHKIVKGFNTRQNYQKAQVNKPIVEKYISDHNLNYEKDRIKVAKIVSKECKLPFNDVRYIITSLKRKNNTIKKNKVTPFHKNKPVNAYFTSNTL